MIVPARREVGVFAAIILIALVMRIWTIDYDLPYVIHPDEPAVIGVSLQVLKSGDLNPHFFHYPSLVFYVHALGYTLYYAFGRLAGIMSTPLDLADLSSIVLGTTLAPDPTIVMLSRAISLLLGVGSVAIVYLIGRSLTKRWEVGAIAALFLAISPTHIYHSRIVTPDVFITFFALCTVFFSVLIFHEGKSWQYVAAGIAVGFTAGSKYNGALVGLVIVVAHFLRTGWAGWKDPRVYLTLPLAAVTFLITTPYAVLDYPAFLEALAFDTSHYATGHSGMEGNTVRWYLGFLWSTTNIVSLLAAFQIIRGVITRSKPTLLLASYPVIYFIFISRFIVRNDRTFLPILPLVFLLAAIPLVDLGHLWRLARDTRTRAIVAACFIFVAAIILVPPARASIGNNLQRNQTHIKALASEWIEDNIPPGSRIAIESYGPYVDPDTYGITPFNQIIDNPPHWYGEQGFKYLILSQGLYGRYFREPDRYTDEVSRYQEFFDTFELVKALASDATEIRIYQVNNQ